MTIFAFDTVTIVLCFIGWQMAKQRSTLRVVSVSSEELAEKSAITQAAKIGAWIMHLSKNPWIRTNTKRGITTAVTIKSDTATFAIKIPHTFLKVGVRWIARITNMFPNDPTMVSEVYKTVVTISPANSSGSLQRDSSSEVAMLCSKHPLSRHVQEVLQFFSSLAKINKSSVILIACKLSLTI